MPVAGKQYCPSCRTCPHGHVYYDRWNPACASCVRDMHTHLTFEGPRIVSLRVYIRDGLRWGLKFEDLLAPSFEDYERLHNWMGSRYESFAKWYQSAPPHFTRASRSQGTG